MIQHRFVLSNKALIFILDPLMKMEGHTDHRGGNEFTPDLVDFELFGCQSSRKTGKRFAGKSPPLVVRSTECSSAPAKT